jgi:hypothetical protein
MISLCPICNHTNQAYPSMSDLSSRLFCKPGGRSQFEFLFVFVTRVRRRWSILQAQMAWSDAPELEDVARERGSYGSRRRELRHLLLGQLQLLRYASTWLYPLPF